VAFADIPVPPSVTHEDAEALLDWLNNTETAALVVESPEWAGLIGHVQTFAVILLGAALNMASPKDTSVFIARMFRAVYAAGYERGKDEAAMLDPDIWGS